MKKVINLIILLISISPLAAQIRFANIFSDNMVLQAHKPIKVWGTAAAGEVVNIFLDRQKQTAIADQTGKWILEFPPMDYGNAISLKAVGDKNVIELKNVLIGEVWLCSGQSNMAMTVNGSGGKVYNYKNEESNANYPEIRSFNVKPNLSAKIGVEVEGRWAVCSPETVSEFSAVAYFFARKVHRETGIPIGIINSSWGGTDIETWISMDAFHRLPDRIKGRYEEPGAGGVEAILQRNEDKRTAFNEVVTNDVGTSEGWYKPSFETGSWKLMRQPQEWSTTELASFDGVAWFRYEFELLDADANQPGLLSLGKVDDNDVTWINGIKIGQTEGAGYDRVYPIPEGVLKSGKNTVVVKVVDAIRGGGFTGTKDDLFIKTKEGQYSLAGDWRYKTAVETNDLHYVDVVPNLYYGLLYNAMIAPLKDFAIKGVIWYQGENNAGRADEYKTLFPALIEDWRSRWGYVFPFYWVQLAAYLPKAEQPPVADSWAELREAQALTLSVEQTGQAITTDIGDANDIHPKNKQEVGARLAYIALRKDYNKTDVVCSGPTYKEMKIDQDKVYIEFENIDSTLCVKSKYGYIEGFSIAGEDRTFVWANAKLEGKNKVVVFSDNVKHPVAVRYCWSTNPDVNLYNSAGLPAAPFRTDKWKLSTEP